ncbi:hypothetical protein [Actinokineospora sp.]|uniref:hypothetical protein n=1 Tax=Actinokineospora sp. TaxID=1872133 RepID=UPI003D6AB313
MRTALVVTAHPDDVDFGAAASFQLRRDISRVIRQVRPDRVLTWSPEINWDMVVTTHPELLHAEGLTPWTVREPWLVDGPATLRTHVSQVGENPTLEEQMRPFFAAVASKYGFPAGHLAEEFQVVDTS